MDNITIFVALNLLSVVIALFIAAISWQRRKISGGGPLFFLMIAVAAWGIFSALEIAALTIPEKIFWSKICYMGTLPTPVLFLILAVSVTGKSHWLNKRNVLLLFIIPVIAFLFAITNEYHGLIWSSFTPHPQNPRILQYGHGILFWAGVIGYSYLCILYGSLLLLRAASRLPFTYRHQSAALLLAGLFPWGGNLVYLSGINLFQGVDLTPISFSITGILLAYAIFRFHLLDLVPVARDLLVENMRDGVIVLDNQNRLLDHNPAAQQLLCNTSKDLLGKTITAVMGEQMAEVEQMDIGAVTDLHIVWRHCHEKTGEKLILDVDVVPITKRQNEYLGRLVTLRDISEQKKIEKELQDANERLQEEIDRTDKLQHILREQAIRDPLTGLYNRRFLNEVLEIELSWAEREHQHVSLILLDLDHFKEFNDTYGHVAGDEMLVNLSEMLRTQIRQGDFACRFGGEEFVIVMPGASSETAVKRGEQWRQQFSETFISFEDQMLQSTFSAGVATFPIHAKTLDALVKAADEALYEAKDMGRDRVIAHNCLLP